MEYFPLRRPRFHRHENFYLICMDLKRPLDDIKHTEMCRQAVSEIISIKRYYVFRDTKYINKKYVFRDTIASISNLFLREFVLI